VLNPYPFSTQVQRKVAMHVAFIVVLEQDPCYDSTNTGAMI
jgi:hypothetical protein